MTAYNKVKDLLDKFQLKFSDYNKRRAFLLLWVQIALILLLSLTAILVCIINIGNYRFIYLVLILGLDLMIGVSLKYNLMGKYETSALFMVIGISLGPWGSILLDETVRKGDFVPIIFIVLSIQICSIFLSERVTIAIAVSQLLLLTAFILSSPNLMELNLPSFFSFIIISSSLGILSSYINRKQIEQIEKQNDNLEETKDKMRVLMIRDPLTGLYNRTYVNEVLSKNRTDNYLAVFMFDIDNLKYVNDNYGHLEGDKLIISAADILKDCFREADTVARIGGDEFIAILPKCDIQMAEAFKNRINKKIISNNKNSQEPYLNVSVSFGFAVTDVKGDTIEKLMRKADELMYADKLGKRST